MVDLGSLLGSELRIPVSLVLTLSWRQVIRSLSSSLSRWAHLARRCKLAKSRLPQLVSLVQIFDAVVEVFFRVGLVFSIGIGLLLIWVISLTRLLNAGEFGKLCVADHTVRIVVTSTQDSLDIFSTWEESVLLEIKDEVWHWDRVVPFGNRVKDAHFDEIGTGLQLSLWLSARSLQSHLFV